MGQKENLLKVARSQLGIKESPAGSNRVKYTAWYPMIGPWCAMFVSWCAEKADIPTSVIPKHAYTPSGRNWFRARGQWGSKPRVGAIAYYNLSGLGRVSHVGIVEKVYSDGSFAAIEGNTDEAGGRTGGKVMRKRRKYMGAGGGFGYPKYDGKASSVSTAGLGGSSDSPYESTSAKHAVGSRVMMKFNAGSDVYWLQRRLYKIGYKITPKSNGDFDKQFGPEMESAVKALQRSAKIEVDGEAGRDTIKAAKMADVKRQLPKVKKAAKKKPAAKKTKAKLVVDGELGRNTKLALQRALGVKADGVIGRGTIKALQRRVGAYPDGVWGRDTTKRLQRRLRVRADGAMGPVTVKALQRRLNEGKL